jgi:hypothetical protein
MVYLRFFQPLLELLQSLETMRDLVLLGLIHLGVPVAASQPLPISKGVVCMAYVLPSYSNIGSQPRLWRMSTAGKINRTIMYV